MKIVAPAYIKDGKLGIRNRPALAANVSAIKDCDVNLIIDTDTRNKTQDQRGYYWSTLVPHTLIILRDEAGLVEWQTKTELDAHDFLKYKFNPVFVIDPETGEEVRLPGSTKKMKKGEASQYIDKIILWAWDTFNYSYPPPKRKEDKYYFSS